MKLAKTMPLRTTNTVNILSLWSIITANKLRHSLGFPSYPFSEKYLWLRLGVFFLQIELEIRAEVWYSGIMEMLTILVGDFSNSKALADKTAGVFFFIFSADSKTAIGEYHK